jgi:MFS family permease
VLHVPRVDDEPSPRRRGLRLLLVALILVAGVIALLAGLRPTHGAYEGWAQAVLHVLWLLACMSLGIGGFYALVGAKGSGLFALVRVPVAIVFTLATMGTIAIGGFILHATLVYDGPRDLPDDHHSDWDWD